MNATITAVDAQHKKSNRKDTGKRVTLIKVISQDFFTRVIN